MFMAKINEEKNKSLSIEGFNDLEKMNEEEIYKFVNVASNDSDFNDVKLIDGESTLHFEYGNALKLGYYIYKKNIDNVEDGLKKIMYNLNSIIDSEAQIGEPFYKFNKYQITDLILDFFQHTRSVSSTINLVYTLRDISNIFPKHFNNPSDWNEVGTYDAMQQIMKKSEKKGYINKGMLLSFLDSTYNRQYAAVLVLLYNGVKLSLVDEIDEMQRIKKEDVKDNGVMINNGTSPRFIELNRMETVIVKEAAQQDYIVRIAKPSLIDLENNQNNYSESSLIESEYLFRPTERKYKKGDKKQEQYTKTISLKRRANELLKEFSELVGETVKIKDITDSGKINAIDEYIKRDYSLPEALTQTLIRFGEWEHKQTIKDENNDAGNKQRKNRLKKLYTIKK